MGCGYVILFLIMVIMTLWHGFLGISNGIEVGWSSDITLKYLAFTFTWLITAIGLYRYDIYKTKEAIKAKESYDKVYEKYLDVYNQAFKQAGVPDKSFVLTVNDYYLPNDNTFNLLKKKYHAWFDDEKLKLFPVRVPQIKSIFPIIERPNSIDFGIKRLRITSINKDEIKFYRVEGEIYRENKISGGGGGGSSIGGAVVGGAIAGAPGAVIGSRKPVNEIKSELITHDTRRVLLTLMDSTKIYFDIDAVEFFENSIPDKNKQIIDNSLAYKLSSKHESEKKATYNLENIEKVRLLKQMLEEGLITVDQYEQKINNIIE